MYCSQTSGSYSACSRCCPASERNHKETWAGCIVSLTTPQIVAQGIEVRIVPERRREGLEGLPRAVRVVVIISGMCRKGALDRGREDSGCAGR
jgi:hypothetical protein